MADNKIPVYTAPQIDQFAGEVAKQFKARPIKTIQDASGQPLAPDANGVVKLPAGTAGGSTTTGGLTLSASRIATR